MKRKLYNYIAANPNTSIGKCAAALGIGYPRATMLINALCQDGVVTMTFAPNENESSFFNGPLYGC